MGHSSSHVRDVFGHAGDTCGKPPTSSTATRSPPAPAAAGRAAAGRGRGQGPGGEQRHQDRGNTAEITQRADCCAQRCAERLAGPFCLVPLFTCQDDSDGPRKRETNIIEEAVQKLSLWCLNHLRRKMKREVIYHVLWVLTHRKDT